MKYGTVFLRRGNVSNSGRSEAGEVWARRSDFLEEKAVSSEADSCGRSGLGGRSRWPDGVSLRDASGKGPWKRHRPRKTEANVRPDPDSQWAVKFRFL